MYKQTADVPLLTKLRSDADADVLADYVLALLRHDGDEQAVRALCEREIPDFLKEDSTIFVHDVFESIHSKSYMPGYVPPPRIPAASYAPTGPSAPAYGNLGMGVPQGAPGGPQNGSRKRSYYERGDGEAQDQGFGGGDPRSYKQPRRGGPTMGRGGQEAFMPNSGRGGYNGRPSPMNLGEIPRFPNIPGTNVPGIDPTMAMSGMPGSPGALPLFDPNNPMAALLAMQALGVPMPPMPGFPQAGSPVGAPFQPAKRPRCNDYDQKGFCAKGNTCQFEHGEHSIWVPPVKRQDEYDPSNSSIVDRGGRGGFRGGDRGRGGVNRGGGQFSGATRRAGRSEFSSDRPNYDKNNTSIVVENIPEEKFSEDEIRSFFSQFGTILEVDMRAYKRLAIIKFDNYDSAKAAYSSPKVIFDNRFVKVYWFVSQDSLPQAPASGANGTAAKNGSGPVPARSTSEPQIDIEEFAKKQEEVQKAHEAKLARQKEMDIAKKDLEKRQEELLKRQAEEKRKLMERIASKSAKSGTPPVKSENGSPAPPSESKSTSQTEALKAQLAALEAEAHSLGLDTSQEEPYYGLRGRGRGRGSYRGRGAFVPRGFRGGYRGRGGGPYFASPGRSFNLDNRTKKVGITGIDFSDPEKDESLRQYLLVSLSIAL